MKTHTTTLLIGALASMLSMLSIPLVSADQSASYMLLPSATTDANGNTGVSSHFLLQDGGITWVGFPAAGATAQVQPPGIASSSQASQSTVGSGNQNSVIPAQSQTAGGARGAGSRTTGKSNLPKTPLGTRGNPGAVAPAPPTLHPSGGGSHGYASSSSSAVRVPPSPIPTWFWVGAILQRATQRVQKLFNGITVPFWFSPSSAVPNPLKPCASAPQPSPVDLTVLLGVLVVAGLQIHSRRKRRTTLKKGSRAAKYRRRRARS